MRMLSNFNQKNKFINTVQYFKIYRIWFPSFNSKTKMLLGKNFRQLEILNEHLLIVDKILRPKNNNTLHRLFQMNIKLKSQSDEDNDEDINQQDSKDGKVLKESNSEVENKLAYEKMISTDTDKKAQMSIKKNYMFHKLEEGPAECAEISRLEGIQVYRDMQLIRRLENTCSALYREKVIRGFCHLYIGQEAIAVGMKYALRQCDRVITSYRSHGWSYVMGIPLLGLIAELAGKSNGVHRGKGSMHMYNNRFFGGSGIVGAQVPLGAGIAMASKYTGDGGVNVCCYGDGAANQGQVFEAYNMACLWKLPCIFVCENNIYGMGTSAKRSSCSDAFYKRGEYIPGIWVDGMDVIATRCATDFAINFVVNNGPVILEMNTYRYFGHSVSDPGTSYRSRDEIKEVRKKSDPIESFKNNLIHYGLLRENEFKVIDEHVKNEINSAVEISKKSGEVDVSELTADVYSQNLEPKVRGLTGFNLNHLQINKGINM